MEQRERQERIEAIKEARERGWITLDEILGLATNSPVDADDATMLSREAGIRIDDDESDPWDEIRTLAEEGPEAFKAVREGPAAAEDIVTDNSAALYLREISRTALLTPEQEVELAQQLEAGVEAKQKLDLGVDDPAERERLQDLIQRGDAARRHMIEANLRLVVSVARKFMNRGLSFLDLVQEGNIGLQKGVEKYDWRKGFRFSTYAYWWIRQAIGRAVAEQGRTIRLPVHIIEQLTKLYNTARALQYELGRSPTMDEIAERHGVDVERVKEAFRAARMPISLEKPVGEDATATLGDLIADQGAPATAQEAEESVLSDTLDTALHRFLTPREAAIVRLRFGLDRGGEERTLGEVGKEVGISRERARQIEAEAMNKLRHAAPFRQQFREYT